MTPTTYRAIAGIAFALVVSACGGTQPIGNGLPPDVTCTTCHGTAGVGNAAPPKSVDGATATTDTAVGAHQSHLHDSAFRQAIACSECHPVPTSVTSPGHNNGVVDLVFGPLATTGGTVPVWDRPSNSCSASYCHGATLPGGTNTSPIWTKVDGTQASCSTCHGDPPPFPHPPRADCNSCHPLTVNSNGTIDVAGGHHINGVIEVIGTSCSSCHGSAANAAPPVSAHGATATNNVGVGAHQSHLQDSAIRKAIACGECHVVPTSVSDPGHIVNGPAPVIFGALASTNGSTPVWNADPVTPTCSNVYCHGSQAPGGTNKTPQWTLVDGTQASCGTCHGNPPPFPHPARPDCNACHPLTVTASGAIDVAGGHHIDGVLDVSFTCSSCHGSSVNAAPPQATTGATATTDVRVGAHQSHLQDSAIRKAVACSECHLVPASIDTPGHIVQGAAPVTFGTLASTNGSAPVWDPDPITPTCSNVYCHGSQAPGGTNKTPQWTLVDGTQASCGTCHGNPPPFPHPERADCNSCHALTVTPAGTIDVAGGHHIDGIIDVSVSCNSCHGSAANPAPPMATTGATATTDIRVGAHQAHLTNGPLRSALACNECHVVPATYGAPGHIVDGPAPVIFGSLASSGGSAPSWDPDPITPTCSNVYCHGDQLAGGTNRTPLWTRVDGTQTACGTCHGNPPPAPHPQNPDCNACHALTVLPSGAIDIAGGHHIDGILDVTSP